MQMVINTKGEKINHLRKPPLNQLKNVSKEQQSHPGTVVLNASTGEQNPTCYQRNSLIQSPQSGATIDSLKHQIIQSSAELKNPELDEIAAQLEQSRSKIFMLLINSSAGLVVMAHQYLSSVDKEGVSPSELFSVNRSNICGNEMPESPVKPSSKFIESQLAICFRKITDQNTKLLSSNSINKHIELIASIHFLPKFIIDISTRIQHQSLADHYSDFDPEFIKQLTEQISRMLTFRSAMVTSNLGLVKYMARRYRAQNMTTEDLQQEGIIGLVKAVDRFDHRRQVRFSTYAAYWVQQTITRSMSKNEKLIRIPVNLSSKAPAVFQMLSSRIQETNHLASVPELARLCGLTENEISTILQFYRSTISLDAYNKDNTDAVSMLDLLEQRQFPSAIKLISESALKQKLYVAVNSLPEKEASVIRCRYGLENQAEMTLQDIATRLHVTRERIRQIQNSGLKKLHLKYGSQLTEFLEAD